MNIAQYIDHTLLKPTTTSDEIKKLCDEANQYGFAAVCVPPPFVGEAKKYLSAGNVKVATVIGFPFGYAVTAAKLAEARQAIQDGAQELDMVINLVALRAGNTALLASDIAAIVEAAHQEGRLVKVIFESGILSDAEIIECCRICAEAGADFVKTSTGYAEKGASVAAVQLMRKHLPSSIQIKASGGIRDYAFAKELVEAGANRLGCSASVAIVTGATQNASGGY
ncbi:deoxyribose-phosphate aldolase [Paraflavitalea sp. CAU 1676]|uniref:deoxyribose-phosphate aldolase n=1 Tax=Paraflavitalea sp. CAU 1676 TaxID=3032598 RepID=UPI0023DB9FF8|nr:deoxyribose-phosphate aldolase [Paraflavitalea sp. CAU 1676]MDF2189420.1 deoxyribose-phosphate aldolase [Paraflavitalea sp. CAU 1676]